MARSHCTASFYRVVRDLYYYFKIVLLLFGLLFDVVFIVDFRDEISRLCTNLHTVPKVEDA